MRTLVAVVGCHRSGTSAVAGSLAHLGLHLGPDLMPASPANPRGYWESMPVVRAHEELLHRQGLTWDVEALPEHRPRQWNVLRARTRLLNVLRECSIGDTFALKDPRMCLFPELWVEVAKLAEVRLAPLYVTRDPAAIVKSLQKRDAFKLEHAQLVVKAHLEGMHRWMNMAGGGPGLKYGQLLEHPLSVLGPALCHLGVELPVSTDQLSAVKSFLTPELNHHGA